MLSVHLFHVCVTIRRYSVADEEYLPLKPNSVDLVISSMSLHWVRREEEWDFFHI